MGSFNLLPADFVRQKAGEALPFHQQALSRAKNFVRTTKRDVKGQIKMHQMRTNKQLVGDQFDTTLVGRAGQAIMRQIEREKGMPASERVKLGAQAQNFSSAAGKTAERLKNRMSQLKRREQGYGKANALTLGGAVLGTAIGLQGIKSYRKWRKKQRTQYRGYDVYPEHEYAAVAQQTHNQPYYNEAREELINLIVESFKQG